MLLLALPAIGGCTAKVAQLESPSGMRLTIYSASFIHDTDIGKLQIKDGAFDGQLEGYKSASRAEQIQALLNLIR